jgi:hypothetical protein
MKVTKNIGIGILTISAIAIAYLVMAVPTRFRLQSVSPSGAIVVRGLLFEGSKKHPLDGTLRLYIGPYKRQTNIPFGRDLDITWMPGQTTETFLIRSNRSALMVWEVKDGNPVCIRGIEHLAEDPYSPKEAEQGVDGKPPEAPQPPR